MRCPCAPPLRGIRSEDRPTPVVPQPLRPAIRRETRRPGERTATADPQRLQQPLLAVRLATTSVGQEGIDFHWWSTPSCTGTCRLTRGLRTTRGRVNRFAPCGAPQHAARHRAEAMNSTEEDPWKAAYDAGRDQSAELGEFAPTGSIPDPSRSSGSSQLPSQPGHGQGRGSQGRPRSLRLASDSRDRRPPRLLKTQRSRWCRRSRA